MSNPFKFLLFFRKISNKTNIIKQDSEACCKYKRHAILSIINTIVAIALGVAAAFILPLVTGNSIEGIIGIVLLLCALVVCALGCLIALIRSLVYLVSQLKINKKAWSWVALVTFLAAIAAVAVAFVLLM